MKNFILFIVVALQIFFPSSTVFTLDKENTKTFHSYKNSSSEHNLEIENEKDIIFELEDVKKTYLNIVQNLSFRNTLWEQSSNFVKIIDKCNLVNLWATGIRDKNGTLLYLISNDNIKLQLRNLFKDNPSWVIENNQNVIESFEIGKFKKLSKNCYSCVIKYNSKHIDGYSQTLKQTVHIENSNKEFKICGFSDITT